MGLFNKVEIKGQILNISELRAGGKTSFLYGIIKSYNEDRGRKTGYVSLRFVAFDKVADDLNALELKKGEVVLLRGSLKDNYYQEKNETQFVVSSFVTDGDRFAYQSDEPKPYKEKPIYEDKPQDEKKDKYSSINIVEDDLPF